MATKKMAFGGMGGKMAKGNKPAPAAQKSAMADKMKPAAKDFMAKKSAAPAMPARPMGGGMGARAGMTRPARPMGGMGMKKGGKAGKK